MTYFPGGLSPPMSAPMLGALCADRARRVRPERSPLGSMKPDRSRPPLEGRFAALQPASTPASGATPANRDRLVVWMKAHSRVALDRAQREIAPAARAVRGPHRQEPGPEPYARGWGAPEGDAPGGGVLRFAAGDAPGGGVRPLAALAALAAQEMASLFSLAIPKVTGIGLLSVRASHGSGRRNDLPLGSTRPDR